MDIRKSTFIDNEVPGLDSKSDPPSTNTIVRILFRKPLVRTRFKNRKRVGTYDKSS